MVNVGIFLVSLFFHLNYGALCFIPRLNVWLVTYNVYRIVTSAFTHLGLLHILFNMLAFLPLGIHLERERGSIIFAATVLGIILLASLIHTFLAAGFLLVFNAQRFWRACSLGFSGVIFGLITLEVVTTTALPGAPTHRDIFGLIRVPALSYPLVLLVLLQLLVPGISFLGHLSGILAGFALVWVPAFRHVINPDWVHEVESWPVLHKVVGHPKFVSATTTTAAAAARDSSLQDQGTFWVPSEAATASSSSSPSPSWLSTFQGALQDAFSSSRSPPQVDVESGHPQESEEPLDEGAREERRQQRLEAAIKRGGTNNHPLYGNDTSSPPPPPPFPPSSSKTSATTDKLEGDLS